MKNTKTRTLNKNDTLVLATHNAGKAREIEDLLKPYVSNFVTAGDLNLPQPEETGATFVENAILKAKAAATVSGKPALADDSGLSVTALGGAPGIYSARWGGEKKKFNIAMQRVHEELGDTKDLSAAFICVLALAWPDGHSAFFEGRADGHISYPPRGNKGFGYDPIFVPVGYDVTFAEMTHAAKNQISHRADVFAKLLKGCFD